MRGGRGHLMGMCNGRGRGRVVRRHLCRLDCWQVRVGLQLQQRLRGRDKGVGVRVRGLGGAKRLRGKEHRRGDRVLREGWGAGWIERGGQRLRIAGAV